MIKKVFFAPIRLWHLVITLFIAIALTILIQFYLAIIVFWEIAGDGAGPYWLSVWRDTIYLLLSIVLLYPIVFFRMWVNCKKGRYAEAKSFLVAAFVILVVELLMAYIWFR